MRNVAILITGLGLLASCSQTPETQTANTGSTGGTADAAHRENYIEDANVVELSLAAQERAGIEVAPITLSSVNASVLVTGSVQPIDRRISHVRPLARGRVQEVLVNIGDRVKADQVLARFDNIEAGELTAEYRSSLADLERLKVEHSNAVRQAERSRSLVEIGAVPAKEAENSEAIAAGLVEAVRAREAAIEGMRARLQRFGTDPQATGLDSITVIRAPFAGVITESEVAPGAVVDSTSLLFAVADLSRVYLEAQVYEKDLGMVRIGQRALVRLEAYPDTPLTGRVAAIRDILDPATRTASVRVEVPNSDGRIKLEMFATVELPTTSEHRGLTVPAGAIQTINGRQIVFVQQDALHFAAREVGVLGEGERVEIVSGLETGEPVVVTGAFQIKSAFLAGQLVGEDE